MFTEKQIWKLLIPLMIEQILTTLMGTVDTMMVTNVGSAAISAVSLVDAINVMVILVFYAMATGGSILCAQYIGDQQKQEAQHVGEQLLLMIVVLASAVAVLCILIRRPLLNLIFGKVDADVMKQSLIYFVITAASYPFVGVYDAGSALFRVDGNSKLPMIVSTISNLLNIAFNALLIYVCKLGVMGAALGTLIARVFSAVAIMIYLRRPKQTIVIRHYGKIRANMSIIKKIATVGIPSGIENGMFQFGKLVIQSTISTLGTTAIAAQAMTAQLEYVTCNLPIGIGMGMMTIVGQCIGAGRLKEARLYAYKLTLYGTISTALVCGIVAAVVKPVTMITDMETEAAAMTVSLTYFVCAVKPLPWSMAFVPEYALMAAGDVKYCMVVSTCSMWICRVAVVVVLIRCFGFGPLGVWIGMLIDWSVRGVFYLVRLLRSKWLTKAVITRKEETA